MVLGYYDAQKVLYGLYGQDYYLDRTMTEEEAYEILLSLTRHPGVSLRELNEEILPALAKRLDVKGDYYELFLTLLERMAQASSISPFRIRTDREFYREVMAAEEKRTPDKLLDLYLNP